MILSESFVRELAYNAGFRGSALDASVNISSCESGFNTNAHKNDAIEDSRGLWQINIKANPQYSSYDLFDPQTNANIAFDLYKQWGNNFGAWTCAKKLNLVNSLTISIGALASICIIVLYLLQDE